MKQENNPLVLSLLISRNKGSEHDITLEDLMYVNYPDVSDCQVKMYSLVIKSLNDGLSYEEISSLIDNIDIEEYKKLNAEEKCYVKNRVKKDVNHRRNNDRKNKGVI